MLPSSALAAPDRMLRCALLVLSLLGAGCAVLPYSTPEGALERALRSARHDRLERLKDALTGPALQAHSSPEALTALGDVLRRIDFIAPVTPVASNPDAEFETTAVARSAGGVPVSYRFRIRCQTFHYESDTPYSKGTCWPDPSGLGLPDICDPDTQASHQEWDIQDCRLTEIALAAR